MAQQDTGLGWSAKSEWLMNVAGQFAAFSEFGGSQFPGQPIPAGLSTAIDVVASGFKVSMLTDPNGYWWNGLTFYAGAESGQAVVFVESDGYRRQTIFAVSAVQGVVVHIATKNSGGSVGEEGTLTCSNSTGTGLYYDSIQAVYMNSTEITAYAPQFATANDGFAAITITNTPLYKLNAGPAVVCVATWINADGDIMNGPIAISTVPANTAISEDGSAPSPNLATDSVLYQGARFYISTIASTSDATVAAGTQLANLTQFGAMLNLKRIFAFLAAESFSNIIVVDAPDPYGENAEEEGGGGEDPDDNPVEEETMPLPAVVGLGFSTIYVPTQSDLFNLAAYLWGGNLDLDNFLKLFANPMDSILGLSAVPLVLSGTPSPIYLGGQQLQGITMPKYTGRTAVKVDMGTATIKERWGSYLDYDPYTELSIYVPFVGIKNIKADDVMGKTIKLMYDIDILSGACIAYIRPEGGSPLYEWSGQCAMQIPITGANWDNIFSTAINTVATLGGALFAPASAPVLGGAVASAASQAIAAKPRIERSGAVNGITGFLGQLRPYIIRTIPEAYIPNDQNQYIGYPSYVSVNLGALTGYNEIASIHLENIPATGDEIAELESILKGGVIF